MTDVTDTNTAHAAALAVRDAAAALARRLPLYYGSGEPADEDLAQAIEDLPLPDVDVIDWRAEAERLRAALDQSQQQTQEALDSWAATLADRRADMARAERYMAERNAARLEAQREAGEMARKLRKERDEARAGLAQAREVLRALDHTEGRCPRGLRGRSPDCKLYAALAAKE